MSNFEIVQLLFGTGAISFIIKTIYNRLISDVKELNKRLSVIEKEVGRIEIEFSKNYVEKEEFKYTFRLISKKFEGFFTNIKNK